MRRAERMLWWHSSLGSGSESGGREELVCALPSATLAMGCCLFTVPGLGFRSSSSLQLTVSHRHAASRAEEQSRELIQLQNLSKEGNFLTCFDLQCDPRNGCLGWEGWKWWQGLDSLPGLLVDAWYLGSTCRFYFRSEGRGQKIQLFPS